MNKIVDFNCTYDNSIGVYNEVTRKLDLKFPEAYLKCDGMVTLSKALKEHDGASFCEMPFCHTVEAEAMGGSVNYGDEKTGPRTKGCVCDSLEEVLNLPEIDFTRGRIYQVLLACEQLTFQGEQVVLEVSGPFTILNGLIDPKHVFRGLRKNPETVKQIFEKIEKEILRYIIEAEKYGVRYISYADSAGAVSIVGPKVAEQMVELFTYDFLKKVECATFDETMILLCPKTTFALLGTEKAKFVDIELNEKMTYGEACLNMRGKVKFAGQMCIKNISYILESKVFKEVKLC